MIELLKEEDLDQVLEIESDSFANPWSKKNFLSEIANNDLSEIYVDIVDGKVVAYGDLWYMFENCDLTKIAVRRSERNKGYGHKMMKHLIAAARRRGCEFMHLEVNVNNKEALGLYESDGFEVVRTRKRYYENGDDAYDMIRSLLGEKEPRKVLAIESSCDETACAIIDEDLNVLSSVVTSQIDVHARFGGVIPEVASRMHVEQISTIIKEAIDKAQVSMDDIDAVAYTIGPGLIGSLHVGAIGAKSLAFFYDKPLIGVHHLKGHIFINELIKPLQYPMMALVVSGGHTELVYIENDQSFKIIGTTLDDAIGEAYDKVARVMKEAYPGGPVIDRLAKGGKPHYQLPTPKVDGLNFSFSGLKNAVLQLVKKEENAGNEINKEDLAYAFQEVALNTLVKKTKIAVEQYPCKSVVIAGGVAANSRLRQLMSENFSDHDLILPPLKYCTDNALMIACAALHYLKAGKFVGFDASSMPSMSIED
ncbi:MAG: tRNA (adenosine(37)-N6)-threonylcarbamoyltransferase complex transferase subunit TsaD [Erysipelotrichaceae bacterium]|nr:tRNA (adenosine(37)-N6)-threonylcarbamoyltransferase complex transferase subunit TsaD [Erysipelotrichaceae bacterium]MBQ5443918.1 tRNA (adenosine(37)-N6)-threonylcarbamoyltransferase complex transferase subunit TsaD [Erysipelotrichaceae bacterium]